MDFLPRRKYARAEIKQLAGLPSDTKGGEWDTGIVFHNGEYIIFTNVGTEGRTGHDYGNRWEGNCLRWYHKKQSRLKWPSVQTLLQKDRRIHVFWRSENDQPFEYAGIATPIEIKDTRPVEILWSFETPEEFQSPDEVPSGTYREGMSHTITVNAYERDPAARMACIDFYGTNCAVCGFSFEDHYGEIGKGFIHVHHLVPISEIGTEYELNPIRDLRPVCPNCHSILHRRRPPLSIPEIKKILR